MANTFQDRRGGRQTGFIGMARSMYVTSQKGVKFAKRNDRRSKRREFAKITKSAYEEYLEDREIYYKELLYEMLESVFDDWNESDLFDEMDLDLQEEDRLAKILPFHYSDYDEDILGDTWGDYS